MKLFNTLSKSRSVESTGKRRIYDRSKLSIELGNVILCCDIGHRENAKCIPGLRRSSVKSKSPQSLFIMLCLGTSHQPNELIQYSHNVVYAYNAVYAYFLVVVQIFLRHYMEYDVRECIIYSTNVSENGVNLENAILVKYYDSPPVQYDHRNKHKWLRLS